MRQQAQDQERREAQKQASSAQQRLSGATPAISVASSLPATPAQVPVEVLKVSREKSTSNMMIWYLFTTLEGTKVVLCLNTRYKLTWKTQQSTTSNKLRGSK